MATYLILNLAVLCVIGLVAVVFKRLYDVKLLLICIGIMLALTLVFDNVIIKTGIVAYDASLITGIKVWVAPIEDFAYAIAAVLLMPIAWKVSSRV